MKATFLSSLQASLHHLLETDPSVLVIGEDILDPYGGAFKVTNGLSTRFPNQVIPTPISEAGFIGIANGMALRGFKPIIEIMFGDFITLGADQIINYASKFQAMYQKELDYHLVIRMAVGAGRGYGPTHSQTLEKMYLGIPNVKILAPSIYHDPGALLEAAVKDTGPVLFLEHKLLYSKPLLGSNFHQQETGDNYPTVKICNTQDHEIDITILTYGGATWIEPLLTKLAQEEIWAEAIFPSALHSAQIPLAIPSIQSSKHAIIIEEGAGGFGWSAQIAQSLTQACWNSLRKPIQVMTAADTIIPASRSLEEQYLPNPSSIEKQIYEVLA